jgi:hypothetical protein
VTLLGATDESNHSTEHEPGVPHLRARQQRLEVSRALSPRPFPLDVIVRTPQELQERIALGDMFLREITIRGKVLYERNRG